MACHSHRAVPLAPTTLHLSSRSAARPTGTPIAREQGAGRNTGGTGRSAPAFFYHGAHRPRATAQPPSGGAAPAAMPRHLAYLPTDCTHWAPVLVGQERAPARALPGLTLRAW